MEVLSPMAAEASGNEGLAGLRRATKPFYEPKTRDGFSRVGMIITIFRFALSFRESRPSLMLRYKKANPLQDGHSSSSNSINSTALIREIVARRSKQ